MISVSPHIRKDISINKIMWGVVLALIPALIGGVYFFGIASLWIVLVCVISAVLAELLIQKLSNRKITFLDGSAVITGLLLGLSLPPTVPLWIPFVGAIIAIGVAKHAFGGLGYNIFNPAMVGRAFLAISWPILMTTWIAPFDAVTTATPLDVSRNKGIDVLVARFGSRTEMYWEMFIGNIGGCIGETSALLLLLGALFLLYKKIITWHTPVTYIAAVGLGTLVLGQDPLLHIFSGALIMGAFFMATDYVTTPLTNRGRLLFGIGAGVLTVVIRLYSGFDEGVMHSILIMNGLTPLIDRYTRPKIFGK